MPAPLKTALMILAFSTVAVADSDEITLVHELRRAFYEPAPKRLAASMRDAVKATCAAPEVPGWLCSGQPLRFVRGVYVTGTKQQKGYVCLEENIGGLKFFAPDMIEADCINVCYDQESKRHFIDPVDLQPSIESSSE